MVNMEKDKVTVFGTETHLQLSTCNPYCIDIFTERATYLSDNTEMTQEIFHLAEDHLKKKKSRKSNLKEFGHSSAGSVKKIIRNSGHLNLDL